MALKPDLIQPYPVVAPDESSDQPSVSDAGAEVNGGKDIWSFFGENPFTFGQRLKDKNADYILNRVSSGELSPLEAQKEIANNPETYGIISPEQSEVLINFLEQYNAKQAYDRSIQSIYDSVLAQQEAAIATGINPSAYIQGQSAGFNAAKAGVSHNNVSSMRFQQKAAMARTALALTGMMASAGIRGGSYIAGRKAVSKLAGSAFSDSISSLGANRPPRSAGKISHRAWQKLVNEIDNAYN